MIKLPNPFMDMPQPTKAKPPKVPRSRLGNPKRKSKRGKTNAKR